MSIRAAAGVVCFANAGVSGRGANFQLRDVIIVIIRRRAHVVCSSRHEKRFAVKLIKNRREISAKTVIRLPDDSLFLQREN